MEPWRLLFGAVALLLLIGCGNVSILLLARATARQHEFAVRSAIGASRKRIIRQLLTESLLLSLTGAMLGLLLAYKTVSVIVANLPEFSFPHEAAIQINLPVLIFSIVIAVGTGILFGLSPAWQLSRPEVNQIMQSNSRKSIGSVRGRRTHNVLIAGQIALTLVMLAGAGAAIQGFLRLAHTQAGLRPPQHHVGGHPHSRRHLQNLAGARRLLRTDARQGRANPRRHHRCHLQQCHAAFEWVQHQI